MRRSPTTDATQTRPAPKRVRENHECAVYRLADRRRRTDRPEEPQQTGEVAVGAAAAGSWADSFAVVAKPARHRVPPRKSGRYRATTPR